MGVCSSSTAERAAHSQRDDLTWEAIELHNSQDPANAWVVLAGQVYDLSAFASLHPGGASSIISARKRGDGDKLFAAFHHSSYLSKVRRFHLGPLQQHPRSSIDSGTSSTTVLGSELSRSSSSSSASSECDASPAARSCPMLSAADPEHARDAWTRCALLRRERISRTAHRFTFAPADPRFAAQCLPGQHLLSISDAVTGARGAARSFTPVRITPDGTFDVVFRVYSSSSSSSTSSEDAPHASTFTETLEALPVGSFVEASTPRGRLTYFAAGAYEISGRAQHATNIGFVAAGTGIAPVYAVLQAALGNPADATRFTLVYASRSSGEALLSAELEDAVERAGGRLRVVHVLSRDVASEDNRSPQKQDAAMTTTVYGRLDEAKLSTYLSAPSVETLIMVCGPPAMVHGLVLPALKSLQHDDEQVFVF